MTREIELSDARLQQSASLPDVLGASFDAFEVIRRLARQCESMEPDLLAAFMSAASAAAGGRDAINGAPALLSAASHPPRLGGRPSREPDPHTAADAIAGLAAVLADRLDSAAYLATTPPDRRACEDGAQAARQIHQLMAPADDRHTR